MEKYCVLVGAAKLEEKITLPKNRFVIAADGGYAQLLQQGIQPDMVIGDFDSLGYVPNHPNIVRHPAEKDDTDMMLAARIGLEQGYKEFLIYGGLGGRWDHSYANMQVLSFLAVNGAKGILMDQEVRMCAIYNDTIYFNESYKGMISVFAASSTASGVTLKGLKYELDHATLSHCVPLGTSNEFLGKPCSISVEEGVLLIMWQKQENDENAEKILNL